MYSISPDYASIEGNTTVTLNGTNFFPQSNYTCVFGTEQRLAEYISDTELQCKTPAFSTKRQVVANLEFFVYSGGKMYTPNYSFDIIGNARFFLLPLKF